VGETGRRGTRRRRRGGKKEEMREKEVQREKEVAQGPEKTFHLVLLLIMILIFLNVEVFMETLSMLTMVETKADVLLRPRDLVSSKMLKPPSEPLPLIVSLVLLILNPLSLLSSSLLRDLDRRTKGRVSTSKDKINVPRDKTTINLVMINIANNFLRFLTINNKVNKVNNSRDSTDLNLFLNIVLNNKDNKESTSCRVKCNRPITSLNNKLNNTSFNLQFHLILQCLIRLTSTTSFLANKEPILNPRSSPSSHKDKASSKDKDKDKDKDKVKSRMLR
jgi:hypothetical protein